MRSPPCRRSCSARRLRLEPGVHARARVPPLWDGRFATFRLLAGLQAPRAVPGELIEWDELERARRHEGFRLPRGRAARRVAEHPGAGRHPALGWPRPAAAPRADGPPGARALDAAPAGAPGPGRSPPTPPSPPRLRPARPARPRRAPRPGCALLTTPSAPAAQATAEAGPAGAEHGQASRPAASGGGSGGHTAARPSRTAAVLDRGRGRARRPLPAGRGRRRAGRASRCPTPAGPRRMLLRGAARSTRRASTSTTSGSPKPHYYDLPDPQDADRYGNADDDSDWENPATFPKLLDWDPRPMVHLHWCRVHNGEFGELRRSSEGVALDRPQPADPAGRPRSNCAAARPTRWCSRVDGGIVPAFEGGSAFDWQPPYTGWTGRDRRGATTSPTTTRRCCRSSSPRPRRT